MTKRILVLFLAGLGILSAAPIAVPPGVQVHRDVAYVENGGPERTLDLYVPEKADAKLPVVIWIHGGAWRSGAKGGWCPAGALLTKGYAVADLNYRLSSTAVWPAQINDCKAAIRWLRANAAQYNLDADHIGVWGHSAGGHLSAMLSVAGKVPELEGDEGNLKYSSEVQAAVDWSGPGDLAAFMNSGNKSSKGMIVQLIEGKGATSTTDEKAKAASPLTYVSKSAAPIVIAHGTVDKVVPVDQSEKLAAALKAAGVDCTFTPVEGKDHGIGGPDLEKNAFDLFEKYLKPAPGSAPAK